MSEHKREWWEPIPPKPMSRCAICGTSAVFAILVDLMHARSPEWTVWDPRLDGVYKCVDEFECYRRSRMNMARRAEVVWS